MKSRIIALIIVIVAALVGWYTYNIQKYPYKLGLDLNGGVHLVFQADTSKLAPAEIPQAMQSLRDVIERRINVFNVSEPLVQVEQANTGTEVIHKLIVELPGETDVKRAVQTIGQTPSLEFALLQSQTAVASGTVATGTPKVVPIRTGLTGQYLKNAQVGFDPTTRQPVVNITFNDEGTALFAKITRENIGKPVAIFLDGKMISSPVVQSEIRDGKAVISGSFNINEAKELVRNLNFGALPVPVKLIGTQTVGASLGADAIHDGVKSGIIGFIIIALFLIAWYRLPGIIATFSLLIYVVLNLAVFKLIPVTLTSAGIAGFILSLGMAVDANILIFERMKEELKRGKTLVASMHEGFARAWTSIRDGNSSSIITAVILYWFATTSLIKGFALVFGIGVVISMLTAITISRTFLYALAPEKESMGRFGRFMFGGKLKQEAVVEAVNGKSVNKK